MANKLQKIEHRPYGREHPYKHDLAERLPRDPIAGQPVTLSVVTQPPRTAEKVWAEWTDDGKQWLKAEAQSIQDTETETEWHASLPAMQAGQQVTYHLCAAQNGHEVHTPDFSFFALQWITTPQITDYLLTADALILTCAAFKSDLVARLTISFPQSHHVHMEWVTAVATNQHASNQTPQTYQLIEASATTIHVTTNQYQLVFNRDPYHLTITHKDGTPILAETSSPNWLVGKGGQVLQLKQAYASPDVEAFYGFGERFNTLDQRGEILDVRVFEQYKGQGSRTYIPVPFLLSSQGYGHFINSDRYVTYDLAASDKTQWTSQAELNAGALAYDLIVANDPWQIVSSLAQLTALPELPPAWAFGPWMSGNDWNSQALVMQQVALTQKHNIPATVMVIEAWSDEHTFYIWNDAQYEPKSDTAAFSLDDFTFPPDGLWPDPKQMVDDLHNQGIRLVLWQIPVMKTLDYPHAQHDLDVAHMIEQGYCVLEADRTPYLIRPFWFHDGLLWDVTNPDGVDWWLRKRAYLLDELGVDGFKTDGGEHMWGRDLLFSNGRSGAELWNQYPNLYVEAYYKFANKKRAGNAITFSRAGYTGAQAFPCHWAGDENSTWEAFRGTVLAGLSAGISGIPFWGWDLGGFSEEIPSADLYLRSAAMATFCPIMQYHSEYNARREPSRDRTPWNIQERTGDKDVIPTFRFFANLRMNLLPYILKEAQQASQNGIPMMRALPLEFPTDIRCRDYPYQYLFGAALLVAPVVEENVANWPVYLPNGHWYDFWTNEYYHGGQEIYYAVPKDRIPVFVRAGSTVYLNLDDTFELGGNVGNNVDQFNILCHKKYPTEYGVVKFIKSSSS